MYVAAEPCRFDRVGASINVGALIRMGASIMLISMGASISMGANFMERQTKRLMRIRPLWRILRARPRDFHMFKIR